MKKLFKKDYNAIQRKYVVEYFCDTTDDVAELPVDDIAAGSTAIDCEGGALYFFSPSKEWVKFSGKNVDPEPEYTTYGYFNSSDSAMLYYNEEENDFVVYMTGNPYEDIVTMNPLVNGNVNVEDFIGWEPGREGKYITLAELQQLKTTTGTHGVYNGLKCYKMLMNEGTLATEDHPINLSATPGWLLIPYEFNTDLDEEHFIQIHPAFLNVPTENHDDEWVGDYLEEVDDKHVRLTKDWKVTVYNYDGTYGAICTVKACVLDKIVVGEGWGVVAKNDAEVMRGNEQLKLAIRFDY